MDDLFRSVLEGHEEIPSSAVKKKLEASLDKKDVQSYKKRWILWKRTALLLLLLLAGFILYDSGILKTGRARSSEKTIAHKSNNPEATTKNNKNVPVQKDNPIGELNKDENNITVTNNTNKNEEGNNIQRQKISDDNAVKNSFIENNKEKTEFSYSNPGNNKIITATPDKEMVKWILTPAPLIENNNSQMTVLHLVQKNTPPIHDSLMKISIAKKSGEKEKNRFNPYWLMTGFASYDFASYKLDSDEPAAITSIKHREAHEPSFSVGILLTRQLTPVLGLQSGIIYVNTAIGMKPQKTYAFRDPTGDVAYKYIASSGYAFIKPGFGPQPVVGDSLTTAEGKHVLENITIPLVVKYKVSGKKISLIPGAGIEANFFTKANLEVDIEDPFNREIVFVKKLNGTKTFYWSFVADAELRYSLNKKMSVSLRPVYRHAISPITKNNIVETFPHSFGIGAGVTIKLK